MTLKNNRAPLLSIIKLCASFQIHRWSQTWVTIRKRSIRVKIDDFFVPRDLEIWWMTLKNNRSPLLYYIEFYASFQSHWWIQTRVTETLNSGQNRQFLSHMTLQFDGWPWKTTGNLSDAASSIRKRPIWVKINDLFSRVTLKFDGWSWKTKGYLF